MKMKNLKKSCLALFILSSVVPFSYAAQELTPEKAASLQSFKEISIRGSYYNESDYARAISKAADKQDAAYFYITSVNSHPSNESLRIIYARLYKADATELVKPQDNFRQFAGIYEYPKATAIHFEPFDIVRLRGYFPTQVALNNAVAKEASSRGAYAFFIDRLVQVNNSGNQQVTAYIFKKDAPERKLQPDNAIPYDSEAGQQALAQGGEAAMQVERPGYYSSSSFNEQFYADKFNNKSVKDVETTTDTNLAAAVKSGETAQNMTANTDAESKTAIAATAPVVSAKPSIVPQKSSRYTVTLPNGTKIEELNDATAAKMVPFDSIKFRGYYVTAQEISFNAGKKAAEKGAKYYHISRIAQDSKGPNKTIYVDLYR
ncbi:DUF1471 domain-containing protein [Orbus wheelerorum]|uniref:YdgH/BhsA/McbA-like domain containing protein n=1 Tax=Orbus wheelerorum TaxID=3074111 RepID=UPI00370D1077